MAELEKVSHLRLGAQGRAVIPARVRKALGLQPGDELVAWVEGDRLILRSRRALVQEMLGAYRHVAPRSSLVDRLIEERRAEVRAEGGA
ncbi:MAG: AbrB/MazE/SpoVT family DNA-binding domain-containing protein [Actinomycetota bacterium]